MYGVKSRTKILRIIFTFLLFFSFLFAQSIYMLPQNLMIVEGKEYVYEFNTPIKVSITSDKKDALKLNGSHIKDNGYKIALSKPIKIQSNQSGKVNLKFKLFGTIPLKTITVNVIPDTNVVPCGNTVGVKIYTKGVLVVGMSSVPDTNGVEKRPCKNVDIEEGDIILSVNNKQINGVKDLMDQIAGSNGNPIYIDIDRNGFTKKIKVIPIKSKDGKFKVGLWVRDSTSGVGTMTFYDPKTKKFGALGHGITDADTGSLLKVGFGDILESSIISVKKGQKGEPGELKGIFLNNEFRIGDILDNNEYGIYGDVKNTETLPNNAVLPVALRNEVKEGPAVILSNIDGRKVEPYTIEIQKVLKQNFQNSKSMVIKVTDSKLITKTGGIVQGMSGSPIIQNGKLVGAVTHVFVNDPTRGYGVFSELMMHNINNVP